MTSMHQATYHPLAVIAERDALAKQEFLGSTTRNGLQLVGPFSTNAEVLDWVKQQTPAVAILDTALDDGPTDNLADILRQRGVLVLVHEEFYVSSTSMPLPSADARRKDDATRRVNVFANERGGR